jgi:ATP-dependent protease ClpP protease subunit
MPKIIEIDGVVGFEVTAESVRNQLKEANGDDIQLEVSSPGGSVFEGLTIYRALQKYKKETGAKITADIMSLAASMGSVIPLAADEITVFNTSVFMIHNAWGISVGNHNDMREVADMLERLSGMILGIYAEKTGMSKEELQNLMDKETFFYGEEIVQNGFADKMENDADKKDESEEIEFAKMSIEEAQNKFTAQERKDDLAKAVAMLKSPERVKNTMEGKKFMDLQDFLKENPEAKAEFNSLIESAKAEGKEESKDVSETMAKERANIKEILALSGVSLSENAEKCIDGGLDAKEFAYFEVKAQKEIVKNEKQDFGKIESRKEIVESKEEVSTAQATVDAELDKLFKKEAK